MSKKIKATLYFLNSSTNSQFLIAIYYHYFHIILGFSSTQTFFLFTLTSLLTIFFEFPAGVFADKVGKNISYQVGALIVLPLPILYFFFNNFFIFILISVLNSLGLSLQSGSIISFANEHYYKNDKRGFLQFSKNLTKYSYAFRALSILIGTTTYLYSFKLTMIFLFLFNLSYLLLSLKLPKNKSISKKDRPLLKVIIREITKSKILILLFFFVLGEMFLIDSAFTLIQPILNYKSTNILLIGFIFFLMASFAVLSSKYAQSIIKNKTDITIMFIIATVSLFPITLFQSQNYLFILISFPIFGFVGLSLRVYIQHLVKNEINPTYFTSAISMIYVADHLGYFFTGLFNGWLLDHFSMNKTIKIVLLSSLIILSILALIILRIKKNSKNN